MRFPEIFYLITFLRKKEALPSLCDVKIERIPEIVKYESGVA